MAERTSAEDGSRRYLSLRDATKFTSMVALVAIFIDASIGHGLLWENDPYWTYWITKTFLIATIFGLGTLLVGVGVGRGAVITAVHTLVLTIYYWSLSPIGLPSSPEWLDLEHTWLTGVPVHFGVIYLGYLLSLWVWGQLPPSEAGDDSDQERDRSRRMGWSALAMSIAILVVAGAMGTVVVGRFPGVTWFVVRLLITFPFIAAWWALAGRGRASAIVGGALLALVWTTYGHFLGPNGLPDLPLRVLEAAPPGATAEWSSYRDLWLLGLPIFTLSMAAIFYLFSDRADRRSEERLGAAVTFALPLVALLVIGLAAPSWTEPTEAQVSASGRAIVERGDWYSDDFREHEGSITVAALDQGGRVTPLPPHDRVRIDAEIETDDGRFTIRAQQPIVSDPIGEHTTWWGVGMHVDHHGRSGIGTKKLPNIDSELAVFALGDVELNGEPIASGVPVHVMTADSGLPSGSRLELDVGREGMSLAMFPEGHLRVLWSDYEGEVPKTGHTARYLMGTVVMVVMLLAALGLNRNGSGTV